MAQMPHAWLRFIVAPTALAAALIVEGHRTIETVRIRASLHIWKQVGMGPWCQGIIRLAWV